jgi:hypothetical protein
MASPQQLPTGDLLESPFFQRLPVFFTGGIGTIFLLMGLVVSWNHLHFLLHSQVATARVTGVEMKDDDSSDSRSRTPYYPRLDLQVRQGKGCPHAEIKSAAHCHRDF